MLKDRRGVEVVFVNNGSTDDSQVVLERECSHVQEYIAKCVKIDVNQGYGFGIIYGLRQADGEVLSWTHADMQTNPADVLAAFDLFSQQLDMKRTFLKGRRIGRNIPDAFFTFGMSVISSIVLKQWLYDVNAQPKMFHRHFMEQMNEFYNKNSAGSGSTNGLKCLGLYT